MKATSYSSNRADKEDSISKSKSNPSLSGGYCPYEDSFEWTDSSSSEDSTSEASVCYFLSPVQDPWATESGRMSMGRREQIPDNSEQLCELPIVQIVDVYLGSHYEDSRNTLDLHGDYQMTDKYLQERMNQSFWTLEGLMRYVNGVLENLKDDEDEEDDEEDDDDDDDDDDDFDDDDPVCSDSPLDEGLQPSTSAFPYTYQVSHQEDNAYQPWPKWKPPENEDISPFPEISPRREDEFIEMISQGTSTEDTLSVSSGQSSYSGTTTCLNVRSIIHWFRKRAVFSLRRRKRPDTASKDPSLQEPKKRCLLRGKKIQPQ